VIVLEVGICIAMGISFIVLGGIWWFWFRRQDPNDP
jgi:hypothetical protein